MSNKVLTFDEKKIYNNLHDEAQVCGDGVAKHPLIKRGKVVFKDKDGNVILERDNEIVLRGRTFALEKLFEAVITGSPYEQNLDRKVSMFKIGSGGAPESNPFEPYEPNYDDMGLTTPQPFLTVDPNKMSDPEKASNPSIVTELSPEQELKYYLPVVDSLDPQVTHYYGKTFESQEWGFDQANNEVFRKLTLLISDLDVRDLNINELSLMIAHYDDLNNSFQQVEAFSRICFPTENFSNLSKSVTVEYYIYA
jgi:hypothetical protein